MSKRLEDFIKKNSAEFDELEPDMELWNQIEKKLPVTELSPTKRKSKTFTLGFVMRVAALIIMVMAVGFLFYIKNEKPAAAVKLADISPEYAKQQVHFASLIQTRRKELKVLTKSTPELYNEFSAEITKMDSTYKKLNADLSNSPNQEYVLRAMIRNLQIQTEILDQQLQVIEQFNNSKKEHHETKNI